MAFSVIHKRLHQVPQKVLLQQDFEAKTGIDVKITYSNNEEMIAKLRATRGGGFDLAQPSQDRISFVQAKFPVYQPIDFSRVNTDQLTKSMVDAVKKNTAVDGKSYGVPHCYGTTGMIVNTKLAPEASDWSSELRSRGCPASPLGLHCAYTCLSLL